MSEYKISIDAADMITLAVLQDHLRYLKEEVRAHVDEGKYLHPEDYHNSMTKLIPALETLIPFFGGEIE